MYNLTSMAALAAVVWATVYRIMTRRGRTKVHCRANVDSHLRRFGACIVAFDLRRQNCRDGPTIAAHSVTIAGELRGEGPMNRQGVDVYPSLNDKVVVVTGAGHGIGRALAERFAGEGSKVVVNDLTADAADAVVAPIRDAGGTAMSGVADVSRSDLVNAMIAAVVDAHGGIDVLVNNAGIVSPMLHFFDADEAWWRRIIDVNLTGHFLVSHPIARIMAKAGGGAIINMSSGGATKAHRAFTAYDATKGGIEALTRAMALDLGPYGIRVNALMPGSIDTSGLSIEETDPAGRERTARAHRRTPRHDRRRPVPGLRRCLLHHRRRHQDRRRHDRPAAVGNGGHHAPVQLPQARGSLAMRIARCLPNRCRCR